jgi:predicted DsbA family dithiol-disulfide isomerase
VHPRAFELHPDLPPDGLPTDEYYPRRYGSAEALADALGRVAEQAAGSGLELRFDRIARMPSTRLAHRLVALAAAQGRAHEALLALFAGHFREGADVGRADEAVAVVAAAVPHLDPAALRDGLEAGKGERRVAAEESLAERMGITGVPFFLAGRSVALSGAHDPDTLRTLVAAARQKAEADAA